MHRLLPTSVIGRNSRGVCLPCLVRKHAICAALGDDEVPALEAITTNVNLQPNEAVVKEGDRRVRVYSLTSGMLRLHRLLPDGRRQISGFLMPGDYLGLADDRVYEQTAEAVVPSSLCSVSVNRMDALMESHPSLKDRLHVMTRGALRQARDSQFALGRLAPVEKIAYFILLLANRATERGAPKNVVELPMSRTDIADFLGLTIETVSRGFTKLKARGLICLPDPRQVQINDRHSLEAVAGLSY